MTKLPTLILGLSGLLFTASLVDARGLRGGTAGSQAAMPVAYPIYYAYPVAPAYVEPGLICPERSVPQAVPQAAPPSGSAAARPNQEPPLAKPLTKGPVINQHRSIGGVVQSAEPRQQLCKVSFWNLSGFDLDLTVGDKVQRVGKDRATVLQL